MKRILLLFFGIFCYFLTFSQVYFTEGDLLLQQETDNPTSLFASDLNNDGYNEILVTSYDGRKVGFYPNLKNGDFDKMTVVDDGFVGPYDVFSADLDGDNLKDIIIGGSGGVAWYKNMGNYNFSEVHLIKSGIGQIRSVYAEDLDGDGDKDIAIAGFTNDLVAWFENLGNGNFGDLNTLTDTMDGAQEVVVLDMDGDGDNDILAGAYYDSLYWFENLGNGNFTAEHLFCSQVNATFSIFLYDYDNDNDLDIFIGDQGDDKVAYYENLGNANFSSQRVISTSYSGIRSVCVSDINGDNSPDVIAAAYFSNQIIWFENLGNDNFSSGSVIFNDNQPQFVIPVDYDNDNDTDLFTSDYTPDDVYCLTNDGTANFTHFQMNPEAQGLYSIKLADLDNDNLPDIVYGTVYSKYIAWLKNKGDGTFEKYNIIATHNIYGFYDVAIADFDGDNDKDIVATTFAGNKVVYYENTGNVNFASPVDICDTMQSPRFIEVADMNNDGKYDFVVTSFYDDRVWVFYGNGNGTFSGPNVVSDQVNGALHFALADLNNDNHIDIIVTSFLDNKIYWLENYDGYNFSDLKTIANLTRPGEPYPVDMDYDGDFDIVCAESQGQYIYWYENDGSGTFTAHLITNYYTYNSVNAIGAADMDNDNDIDIVVGSSYADKLVWYKNKGDQTWDNPVLIADDYEDPSDMIIYDLNSDNYPDFFVSADGTPKIAWFENIHLDILSQPKDTMVCTYDNTFFKVSTENASGFQWKVSYNGGASFTDVQNNDTYTGADDSVLYINNISANMSGYKYYCVVSNAGGSTNTDTVMLWVDTIFPQLQVNTISLYLDTNGIATLLPQDVIASASDNCSISDTLISKTQFSCSDVGNNTITVYLTDTKGNTTQKNTTVSVFDTIKPRIFTSEINLYLDQTGQASISASDINTSDNCGISQINFSKQNFSCNDLGNNQITVTVSDNNGNISEKNITVNVFDTIFPQLTVKNLSLYLDSSGNAQIIPDSIIISLSDNCTLTDTFITPQFFNCQSEEENSVMISIIDIAGNQVEKSSTVFVYDTISPQLTVDTMFLYLDENGQANLDTQNLPFYDNCQLTYLNISQSEFNCSQIGTHNVSIDMYDGHTDTVYSQLIVVVKDSLQPTVGLDTLYLYLDQNGNTAFDLNTIPISDNCQIVFSNASQTEFDCSQLDDNQVIITVFDGNSDTLYHNLWVIVYDTIKPFLVCPFDSITVSIPEGDSVYSVQNNEFDPTDTGDNCQIAQISNDYNNNSTLSGTALQSGIYYITWFVSDFAGNKDSCMLKIKVNGNNTYVPLSDKFKVWPNPTEGKIFIQLPKIEIRSIKIYDISGKCVYQSFANPNNYLDLGNLENGTYLLKIQTLQEVFYSKIILK